ncbi:MAG TPA: glycosyltransferase family 39 protein [Chloroflexota bacterium]|nr:glycosyltransferase family 39 protein [Chloroflexota bacterium]
MSHRPPRIVRRLDGIGWWGAALVVVGVAFALRIHALAAPNLTGDEWFMLRNHDEGPAWIIHQAHTFEPHPLLYYLGLAGWIEVVGRGEFSMRFPSLLFGVLLTPSLIALGRAMIGRWGGIFAGALVAVNPYQIAESQNARNYAMVVSLSALASVLFVRALERRRRRDWIAYGVVMWLALNSHYDAALVLAAHVLYFGGRWLWAARTGEEPAWRPIFRSWLTTTSVVSGLFVLWLLYAWPALVAYHGYFPTPVGIDRVLARSLATFTLGATVATRQAAPAFLLAAVGAIWLILRRPAAAFFLLVYTLLPIVAVGLLFFFRPMFDARYLIVLAPGYLLLLAAGLDGLRRAFWPLGVVATLGIAYVVLPKLPATYASMLTDRGNYRGMAAWVESYGGANDPIVATGYGQAELFGYYYHGPQKIQIIDQPTDLSRELPALLDQHPGLWLLPYWDSPTDTTALTLLDRVAAPSAERWFVNVRAFYYASPKSISRVTDAQAQWQDRIALDRASLTNGAITAGDALAAKLDWSVTSPVSTPKVSFRLLDQTGQVIAQSDTLLNAQSRLPAGQWSSRLGLLVPSATPPGQYDAAILLYNPQSGAAVPFSGQSAHPGNVLPLGSIQVRARERPTLATETEVPLGPKLSFASGVSVLGHDPLGPPRSAGDRLSFRILWRADRAPLSDLTRTVSFVDAAGHTVAQQTDPILPEYPTSKWHVGQLFAERIEVQIPPTAANGRYQLAVSVDPSQGSSLDLGTIDVNGPARSFTRPTIGHPLSASFGPFATLIGADLPTTPVRPGGVLTLRLYWQARQTAKHAYVVFVHLLAPDGRIFGQVDRPPVDGTRPTDGWLPGEYLSDSYQVPIPANAPAGRYHIEIGLYDPSNGVRLPVAIPNQPSSDHLVLGEVDVAK